MARPIRNKPSDLAAPVRRRVEPAARRGAQPQRWEPLAQTAAGSAAHTWIPLLLIAAAVGVAFSPAWHYPFTSWDDGINYQGNEYIRGFSQRNLRWMFTQELLGVWQPLSWIVAACEWELFGKVGDGQLQYSNGIHIVNIALQAIAAALCFLVMRRLIVLGLADRGPPSPRALAAGATLAGLFFAVHPLRVETVSWATAQPYILAMIGCVASVWCYLRANERAEYRVGWHAAAVICFALSLLCKSIAVPLVAVLLVLDVYPLRRVGGRAGWRPGMLWRMAWEKIPYAVITLGAVIMAVWATAQEKAYPSEPAMEKLLVASFCMLFYVVLTIVPWRIGTNWGIAPNYQKPLPFMQNGDYDPMFTGALVILIAVMGLMLVLLILRRTTWLLAAWAVYCVILLPVVGFVKHGGQMAADRYTFLACIPWAVLLGAALTRLWQKAEANAGWRPMRFGASGLAVAACAGLGVMAWRQTSVWRDSIAVWEAMIARNPRWYMGPYNVAKVYKEAGQMSKAKEMYERAISLNKYYPEAHIDLGNMYKTSGDRRTALMHYELSLRGRPNFHMAEYNIATILAGEGRYDEAIERLKIADADAHRLREKHRYVMIALEMSRMWTKQSRFAEALARLNLALREAREYDRLGDLPPLKTELDRVEGLREQHGAQR